MAHLCGYLTGDVTDPTRSNWDNDGPRPIKWSAWYPAAEVRDAPVLGLFDLGDLQPGAPLEHNGSPFPVVLLSHGTGGTAESLGWLARELALAGYVVMAANHHGNTGAEPYRAEGFLCWWERMPDLSRLLDTVAQQPPLAGHLDLIQFSAVGFSLGAYAVLGLAGAVTSLDRFEAWRVREAPDVAGPPEFPDAARQFPTLRDTSAAFRASLDRDRANYRDPRVQAVVAIAAPPTFQGFSPESVTGITCPVTLITGGADREAPFAPCSGWLMMQNPNFNHVAMGPKVGHYAFLGAARPGEALPEFLAETPGVNRAHVQRRTLAAVLAALKPVA